MKQYVLIIFLFLTAYSCTRDERPETIFIDDVVQSKDQLKKLDTSEIFSYAKYIPEEASAPEYYYKGKDTIVIVVKTKNVETSLQRQRHALLNRFLDSVDKGADILIVEDGILLRSDSLKSLRALSPNLLSNVDTMEWHDAKELYGPPARLITLIVNLYHPRINYKP